MKTVIKITFSQLEALDSLFDGLGEFTHADRETKVRRSVLDKVVIRLKKKLIDERAARNLLNQKKKIKLSFEYYEAHYLELFLEVFDVLSTIENVHTKTTINYIRAELNAKLA